MKNEKWKIRTKIRQDSEIALIIIFLFLISYFLFPSYCYSSNPIKVIKAIEVKGLNRIEEEELIDIICFGVGDIIDMKELSAGIRRAFKKGIFLDIKAVSEPYNGGIKLTYVVEEIPVIQEITFKGNNYFPKRKIKKIFAFKDGEEFKEELVNKAKSDLLYFYQRKGFDEAAVEIILKHGKKPSTVKLLVHIKEEKPLTVEHITIPDDAARYLRISEGDNFDRDMLDEDMRKIRDYYKSKSYIKPTVGPYEFIKGDLIIPVKKGQRLELSFSGNSAFNKKKLKEEIPFLDEEEVSEDSIEEAVERLRKLYLSKGYYYADIAAGVEDMEEIVRVSFIIFEGKRGVLRKVYFEGMSFSADVIKEFIPLKEDKPYNENLLETGEESLTRFYNALGYLKMDIRNIKKDFQKDGSELNLTFVLHEGPQTKIKSIEVIGNRDIGTPEIINALQLATDTPYNVTDIGDARYRVLSLYGRQGYIDAQIDVESVINEEKALLKFNITENRPSVIGKIILRGNQKTKAKILRRELTVEKGDPYDFEELLTIKQRLYRLGLFNEVSIDLLEARHEKDNQLVKDMVVSVKEGKAGSVEFGVGYGDYENLRVSFDIRYSNIGGYDREIGLKTEFSSVEERYVLNFREPWLFNKPNLPFNFLIMREDTEKVNLDTDDVLYKIEKFSLIADIEKELTERLKTNLSYEYSFTDTTDVQPGVILSKEDTGTIGIGSISPSLFYDRRDNPFNPTSGSIHGIVIKFASKAFLSETRFIKGTFQNSWYYQLIKGIVFAFSWRGGAAYSFEGTKELPLIERFFLGGRTTARGYSEDTLGPKGNDDNPTGGNAFALVNGEMRFSLGKGFGLVTFVDAGNVWQLIGDISTKLKYSTGAGLRYNTPVGPVSIDYGHKLNREEGESSGELHFSFGHAF
jgi:outer membrane protein insertion porin family